MTSPSTTIPRGITLYRSILRAHKKFLPLEMKQLGDAYVRHEFKAHRDTQQQQHMTSFFQEWDAYLHQITVTARARDSLSSAVIDNNNNSKGGGEVFAFGSHLPADVELSEEQAQQLEKLRQETEKFGKSA